MATYKIPVVKGKSSVEVDSQKVDENLYAYALQLGFKALVNRMSKIKKEDFSSVEDYQKAAMAKAEELVACLYSGKGIRMVGVKAAAKTAGAEKVEARRIAREIVKSQIKAAGEKLNAYSAKDITEAADALIEANPEIVEQAKANLAERAEKAAKISVDLTKISKTGKGPKAKTSDDGTLSATQAGIPVKRKGAKPAQQLNA